jgi:hypothetical protein
MFSAGTILSIISAVLAIARFFVSYAEQQKWMEAGAAQAALQGIQEADNAIAKAKAARQAVRDKLAREPDSLRDDDGFQRKD